jgi:DNA-binding transcriptional LysR family regulator
VSVEIRDLRWAIVAAQHRSLRQAAETLDIRQSTLSRGLRHLEFLLGATLFERTNGGTRPTVVGQEFLDAARRIVDETEAINLRATLVDHRHRFPDVETQLVDGSSDQLISEVASSAIDVAFVAENYSERDNKSLSVWSERVVVAVPVDHPLASHDVVHWGELRNEVFLITQRGPGPEFLNLVVSRIGHCDPCRLLRHDVGLDRLLTLVGAGWGILLGLEGATGVAYPGVTYREVHDTDGPTRLAFRAYWRQANCNPSLAPFLDILRERYPDLSGALAPG